MASVFDQAEKLEQTPGATSASAGNVFDQAEQLDAPKTSKVFPIPKVGLTGTENIGPALPYASSNPSPSLSDAAVSAASSVGSFAGDVLGGFGKGAAKTFYGLARAASDPEQFSDEAGKQRARAFQAQHLTPPSDIEPSNVGEKIGNVGENVAEFLLPAGEAAKGAEATKAAFGGTKLARMAALGVRSAGEGAFGALQEYAKSGGDADKAKSAGLSQAATSAVLGGVGAGLSKLGRSGYANLFKLSPGDFAYGRDPLEAVRVSGVGIVNSLSELKQKLAAELAEHGRVIGDMLDLSPNASTFDRAEIGRQIRTAAAEHSNGLEFFGGDASSLQRMADNVATSAENASTLRELHELKTSVGKQVGWAGESQIENARQAALREIYGRLNEFISANSPGLREQQAQWSGLLTASKALDKEIARRQGAKVTAPLITTSAALMGHPIPLAVKLAGKVGMSQPAVVTRLAKLGEPTYAPMARAGARYLLNRLGIRPFVEDNSEGSAESRDSYAGQK